MTFARTRPVAAVTNLAWVVAAVGDYGGDARSDVFWRNGSTGANVIWLSANAAHVLATRAVTNPDWVVVR